MVDRQLLSILMGLTGKEVFEGGKSGNIWLEYLHCSDSLSFDIGVTCLA